jgi:hypothetical protein
MAIITEERLFTSRAVVRPINPGSLVYCAHCDDHVVFKARDKSPQVICNVYDHGTWQRVEHYHAACYELAGAPHGIPRP